jgi:hypothetical protein
VKDTNDETEPIDIEDSPGQENGSKGPKRKLLRTPATRMGRILFAVVVATVIIGGSYAVVKLSRQSITQTSPSVPVGSTSAGCIYLSATPSSVLLGDGGGDVKFDCSGAMSNGTAKTSTALTTINATAVLEVTGVFVSGIFQGNYSGYFYLYPSSYQGPFGAGYGCSFIPGVSVVIPPAHFGHPITIGTGSWDYCLNYDNQTSAGSLNPITVTWTPVGYASIGSPITQSGPSVPVESFAAECTVLTAFPSSVLAGDGGGDIMFDCSDTPGGSAAFDTINATAVPRIVGAVGSGPGTYLDVFVFDATYGPHAGLNNYGPGNSCHNLPGAIMIWNGRVSITFGTGSWNYCADYSNQTSGGSLGSFTVTWTSP